MLEKTLIVCTGLVICLAVLNGQQQPTDGGYFIFGHSNSYSDTGSDYDLLLFKVNADGAKQWRKNYWGSGNEYSGDGS